jgi:hypothetical protein
MIEIKLEGLNARQKVLADIMWELEEYEDVERFMATLPERERIECQGIIEMMKMELVESYREGMELEKTPEADRVIKKLLDKR